MNSDLSVVPTCRLCRAPLYQVSSGLICGECRARIIPNAMYEAESHFPIRWRSVGKIVQKTVRRWWRTETAREQDNHLAKIGCRQVRLFD